MDLVTQLETLVSEAQAALTAAQAAANPPTVDPVVTAVISALEGEGYTVSSPNAPSAPTSDAPADGDVADNTPSGQ